MSVLPTVKDFAEFVGPVPFYFGMAQVPISQAQVALKINVNEATNGNMNITGIPMPYAGSIVGLTEVIGPNNKTAGVLGCSPTINGTEVASTHSLYRLPVPNGAAKFASKFIDAQGIGSRFAAGDLIGSKLTSDASFLPTTDDILVIVWVIFEGVQP